MILLLGVRAVHVKQIKMVPKTLPAGYCDTCISILGQWTSVANHWLKLTINENECNADIYNLNIFSVEFHKSKARQNILFYFKPTNMIHNQSCLPL